MQRLRVGHVPPAEGLLGAGVPAGWRPAGGRQPEGGSRVLAACFEHHHGGAGHLGGSGGPLSRGIIRKVPPGPGPERSPRTMKVAQADSRGQELAQSSSPDREKARGPRRSPPRISSPQWGTSPPRARSPSALDPTLQAVQTAIERRRWQEQVSSQCRAVPWSPPGHGAHGVNRCGSWAHP